MGEMNKTKSPHTPGEASGPRLAGDLETSGGPINKHLDTDNAFSAAGLDNDRASREAVNKATFTE